MNRDRENKTNLLTTISCSAQNETSGPMRGGDRECGSVLSCPRLVKLADR